MNIATILFTYNRNEHTRKTLDALKKNKEIPQKLFIFQDGFKGDQPDDNWTKVNEIIQSVDWCETEVIVSKRNKGLANAIFDGVSQVFCKFDAVIVLEDDCVTHPLFMSFMNMSLEKYENTKQVYSVTGNAIPLDVPSNGTDAYFSGRIDTWGWGTWKDRWSKMKMDYTLLGRIKTNPELNYQFEIWGKDLELYLLNNIYGKGSSWATFWGMTVIENKGLCLAAYESFVHCIGLDGTGTNCDKITYFQKDRKLDNLKPISLPDEIVINDGVSQIYKEYFAWTSALEKNELYKECLINIVKIYQDGKKVCDILKSNQINNVAIWGRGKITELLVRDFKNEIKIDVIIESYPQSDSFNDIDVVDYKNIPSNVNTIIIIPSYDSEIILNKLKKVGKYRLIKIEELVSGNV